MSLTFVLYPPPSSMDIISFWCPPISFHTFSTTYPTIFQPSLSSFPSILPFKFLVLSEYIPNYALNIVLLSVFEHPSIFFAAVIGTGSNFFTSFTFPSHTSAYSSFDTITFIRIHILILVSRCESLRITSILPIYTLPFLSLY